MAIGFPEKTLDLPIDSESRLSLARGVRDEIKALHSGGMTQPKGDLDERKASSEGVHRHRTDRGRASRESRYMRRVPR